MKRPTPSTQPISPPETAGVRGLAMAEQKEFESGQAHRPMMLALYQRAEAQVRSQPKSRPPHPEAQAARLLHELQVHQVELEMQNAELRQTRAQLEAAVESYSDLYDFAPVGYFTLEADGTIQRANLTGASLVGLERSRLVGRSFGHLLAPTLRSTFRVFLARVLATPDRQSAQFTLLKAGQVPLIVSIQAQRFPNSDACRLVVVDITERQKADDRIRASEVRYRRLFEAAHDGVLLLDPVTRKITDANPFMTRLLGYAHDQLVGRELFEIGLLKDETASQEMFRRLKRRHEVRYEDLPLESKGGQHQEVEVVANMYEEEGISVIQCNIRDITERKKAEGVTRQSESLLSTLIEQAPVGVYVIDRHFRILQVNSKARPVFKGAHPLIGRDFAEVHRLIWPKRISDPIVARFRHTLKTGKPYQSPEFTARRRDSDVDATYEWQIQRVTLPGGEFAVVCFFNDITERKRAEQMQRRMEILGASNRKLEREIIRREIVQNSLKQSEHHQRVLLDQARRMQEELRHLSREVLSAQEEERKEISRELHDVIAQTLTGINLRLAGLKREASTGIKGLDRSIARTQRLVQNSVDIVQRFARELRPAVLDDLGLLAALHSFMKSFSTRTGIPTRLTGFAAVEQLNMAQRTVLFRVAQEALTNVARHARAGRVEVSIKRVPRGVCMRVTDDGKSFSLERVLKATGRKRLGLLGMRERVQMVGGGLRIESAPGKGTTIEAVIPCVQPNGRRQTTASATSNSKPDSL